MFFYIVLTPMVYAVPAIRVNTSKSTYTFTSVESTTEIFIPNFVCVLTNKRYKTYQTKSSFCGVGHAPGVGLGVLWGKKNSRGFAIACSS